MSPRYPDLWIGSLAFAVGGRFCRRSAASVPKGALMFGKIATMAGDPQGDIRDAFDAASGISDSNEWVRWDAELATTPVCFTEWTSERWGERARPSASDEAWNRGDQAAEARGDSATTAHELGPTPRPHRRRFRRAGLFVHRTPSATWTMTDGVANGPTSDTNKSGTITSQMVLCCSGGGDGTTPTAVMTTITEGLPTNGAGLVRLTLETTATEGATVTLRYQVSADNRNWGATGHAFQAAPTLSSDGIAYQTEFMTSSPNNALYWRVCAHVVNTSLSDTQTRSALVRARVDWRQE